MTNSLLDFVMSLVRDPDAAARYAQDPAQAIADAHLTDVTSADVNHLIPVVSESLSTGAPGALGAEAADANVWASGAATAAFDAFADPVSAVITDHHPVVVDHLAAPPIDSGVDALVPDLAPLDLPTFDEAVQDFQVDDLTVADAATFDHPTFHDHGLIDTFDDGGFFQ